MLAALEKRADGATKAAGPMVAALRERSWEGDDVLADQLEGWEAVWHGISAFFRWIWTNWPASSTSPGRRSDSSEVWLSTRRPEVVRAFDPTEVLRLTRSHGERRHHQLTATTDKKARLARRQLHLLLLPAMTILARGLPADAQRASLCAVNDVYGLVLDVDQIPDAEAGCAGAVGLARPGEPGDG